MQQSLLPPTGDFSGEVPLIGLSGGINSAALLCYLASETPTEHRPQRVLLYYAHLREHSDDTFPFVRDCIRYARAHFPEVEFRMHRDSMLAFIRREKIIPHPTVSPCTWDLKVERMEAWGNERGATCDLIGYVRQARRRLRNQTHRLFGLPPEAKKLPSAEWWREYGHLVGSGFKRYPIAHLTDADCFSIVTREIGWYPAIYDLRTETGKPAFRNNNCLPCKNMDGPQRRLVQLHFPDQWERAVDAAEEVGSYWGRADEYAGDPCAVCAFD